MTDIGTTPLSLGFAIITNRGAAGQEAERKGQERLFLVLEDLVDAGADEGAGFAAI